MSDNLKLDPKQLYFIPMGGSEQFGVNFNLYSHQDRWLAIDCGIGFADNRFPGIDILIPDVSFLEERADKLEGLIVTHAHEDHVGAVPRVWQRLRCPIYCTEFTAQVLQHKIREFPEARDAEIVIIKPGDRIELGPFTVEFIEVAHSIPDTCSVVVRTKVGNVLHSGDWNLDPNPVLGGKTDEKAFRALGDEKPRLTYIGDSTNANVAGRSGSESEVEKGLAKVFKEHKGRIGVTIFASNVGRLQSICRAAKACDRRVAFAGRSLHTMVGAAKNCGYLQDIEDFVSEEDIGYLPEDKQVIILTGSQGESRAALARVARGEHKNISFGHKDTVVFSARAIPGNEADINAVINNLVGAGVTVVTPNDTKHIIHVSGHPRRDEVIDMFQWIKPSTVIPVHGERMQLEAHAEIARGCQVEDVIVPSNGSVITLGPGAPAVVDHVETGMEAIESRRVLDSGHKSIVERRKFQYTGALFITLAVSPRGDLLRYPDISAVGLIDYEDEDGQELLLDLRDEIEDIMADMKRDDLYDDHAIHEEVRIGARRLVSMLLGMKPMTYVHVVRV